MGERAAVVVVGAGATGLAIARELARAGHRPLVLERFELGHTRGSSHGTARIVRLAHDRVEDVRDAVLALDLWRSLERSTRTQLLIRVGGLEFGSDASRTLAALRTCEVPAEMLAPEDIERRFPAVRAHGQPAVFQADAAIALAEMTCAALARDAVRHGAEIRARTPVERLQANAEAVQLETSSGRIRARCVVLAAGGWIGPLAAQVGLELPARPTLQTPVHFALPAAAIGSLPTIVDFDDSGDAFYALPQPEGGVVKGGLHNAGAPVDLDGGRDPDDEVAAPFRRWAARRFAGLGAELDAYGCVYTSLPDDRFALERRDRIVIASCCSGRGFKFVPLTGARGAALAAEALRA